MEYATREAREATFAPPSKRSKAGWPHKTPAATDLAKAGFYYKPQPHSNDNAACFLCDRNLDGWEAEDDPLQEHLKHAPDCGWAIVRNLEALNEHDTSNMEDPTGPQITDARRATFAIGWPHESKRGWTCKTDKMVEAGWYFAPTSGSEDYVSCAYCKLSLDGWEPKDNPFEEHYSRSPSCPFFVFAGTTAPSKRPKAKKGRVSRASRTSKASTRLSTQSNATLQPEVSIIPDLDESIDTSAVSLLSTASTATTKGKRKAGTTRSKTTNTKRTKTTRSKKAKDAESEVAPELEVSEETTTDAISYPQIDSQAEHESREPNTPVDVEGENVTKEQTPKDGSPDATTGPPRLPTPTIPVSIESPVQKETQKRRSETSLRRPVPETQIQAAVTTPHSSPSQPSDVENAPPSTRPESVRPPRSSPGIEASKWTAVDVEMIFEGVSGDANGKPAATGDMTDEEKQMSVHEWIRHIAEKAENELRAEGEKVVGVFEKEGQRALSVLEAIVCI